jgi:gas vesicle protein
MGQGTEEQLTGQIADTRQGLSRDVDALYDKVSPGRIVERRKEAVRGRLSSVKDSVMGSAGSAGDSAQGVVASVKDSASGATSAVAGTAQSAVGTIERQTQGAPLAAGMIAFGAGMVISALIPASEKEAQAAERLTEAVKDSPIIDEAKAAGQEIGDNLKESATQAAQEVKSSAQDSAATLKDEGQSSAQTVKEETPGA